MALLQQRISGEDHVLVSQGSTAISQTESVERKPRWRIALAGSVVCALVIWWIVREVEAIRTPLSTRCEVAAADMLKGNASALMKYATRRELDTTGLTSARLQAVIDQLLLPYLKQARLPKYSSGESTGGINGVASVEIYRPDGTTVRIPFEIWRTDEGPKGAVLTQVLLDADLIRYSRHQQVYPRDEQIRVMLLGIQKDKAFLKSIGLTGLCPIEPTRGYRDWDALEREWEGVMRKDAELEASANKQYGNSLRRLRP